MIGAIVRNNIVETCIVINPEQVEEMQKALGCEIVDARPYGLTVGDLRTARGWTRNEGGEQAVLPELEPEDYSSYTLAMQRAGEAEKRAETAEETAAAEAAAIVAGEIEDESKPALMAVRRSLDSFVAKIADAPKEINENVSAVRAWTPGNYSIGDVRMYGNIPYKCVQAHDSTANDGWTPPTVPALWMQYHGTSRESAREWVQPQGAHDAYRTGEWCSYQGQTYECVSDNNVYAPGVVPGAWEARA